MGYEALAREAEALARTSIWARMAHLSLFAVRFEDGRAEYVSVLSWAQDRRALALYADESALSTHFTLPEDMPTGDSDWEDAFLWQECLTYFPDEAPARTFLSHGICRKPRALSEAEAARMLTALRAARALAERLELIEAGKIMQLVPMGRAASGAQSLTVCDMTGPQPLFDSAPMPKFVETPYPSACIQDELLLRRLRKKPLTPGRRVQCALRVLPVPACEEDPENLQTLFVFRDSEHTQFAHYAPDRYVDSCTGMADRFIGYVMREAKPECVYVNNLPAFALIQPFCAQVGIPVRIRKQA